VNVKGFSGNAKNVNRINETPRVREGMLNGFSVRLVAYISCLVMYSAVSCKSTSSSNLDGFSDNNPIRHIATTEIWDRDGQNVKIDRPSESKTGDLLVLALHRTDADLPLKLKGWTRAAECFKQANGYDCVTAEDCVAWESNSDFCRTFKYKKDNVKGHDLAQVIFYKTVLDYEPSSYTFDLNITSGSHPGWAILTALRGADTTNPIRNWANEGNDGESDSKFPSVIGKKGDMLLLSQSFDDEIAQSKFNPPDGTRLFGYVANSDESGFLFGGTLNSSGETGPMKTHGRGGPKAKDALISLTIRPK
jgi:hypothetical protein